MQIKEIVERTKKIAGPAAESLGLSLWDVEFVKEGGEYTLTVYIDREGGVDIESCEAVSRMIDPMLDEQDYIDVSYTLCVSSAGLTRALRRPEHFEWALGKKVEIKLFSPINGVKEDAGELVSYDGGVVIKNASGEVRYESGNIALCRLAFEQ